MSHISEEQLAELRRRSELPDDDPQFISAEQLAGFLGVGSYAGVPFDLRPAIQMLIEAGIPRALSIAEGAFRGAWPEFVNIPTGYYGRFPYVLPVVRGNLSLLTLAQIAGVEAPFSIDRIYDIAAVPQAGCGASFTRYVAFLQDGSTNKGMTPQVWRAGQGHDEVGLTAFEACFIPIVYPALLRNSGIGLPGSQFLPKSRQAGGGRRNRGAHRPHRARPEDERSGGPQLHARLLGLPWYRDRITRILRRSGCVAQ